MPDQIEAKDKTRKLSEEGSKRYEFIKELAQKVRDDDDAREIWKNKQIVASNQRLGIKRRRDRGNAYPGYSEVPIPVTDKIIKKLKSLFVSVATFSKKQIVVTLEEGLPQPQDARQRANKIEKALNGLIRKRTFQWTKNVSLFVDYFLENGHAIFKVIEKFFSKTISRTIEVGELNVEELKGLRKQELIQLLADKEGMDVENKDDRKELESAYKQFKGGKDVLKFKKRVVFSEPTVLPERGLRIIVPPGTTDLQRAPRVTHDMWFTLQELKEKAASGVYDKSVIEQLVEDQGINDDSLTSTAWDLAEGVSTKETKSTSELFNVRECQTWYEGKKWVFSWLEEIGNSTKKTDENPANQSVKVVQEVDFPYDHGMWTYVKHDHELKNKRWYSSRGVPEQIRGMQYIMEKSFNARVIRDEYNNNPMFRVSRQLGMSGDEIRLKPGQVIEAEAGEIEQINKAITTDISSERIEQQAKAYIEEYQSIVDFSVRSAVNQGGSRTATEIQAVRGAAQQQLNTEVAIFLESLSEVANQMFLILRQIVRGPRVVGNVLLEPSDFEINATVSWVGSVEASNHELQMAKALQRIDVLTKIALPAGIMTQENLYLSLKDWLEKDPEIEDPNMFITMPQEVQVDEAEDQMSEIIMMQNGFNPVVKPKDNHEVHIAVMEQYLNSEIGASLIQSNPAFNQAFQQHLNIHLEAEKTLKQGGNTDDPRRRRVLQSFTNQQEASS